MSTIELAEKGLIPDFLIRRGIRALCRQRLKDEHADDPVLQYEVFRRRIETLQESPIAIHAEAANRQHYEVPAAFFEKALGKHLKYSSCYWDRGISTLDDAEAAMLKLCCERALLDDHQKILELGCGWGSLTLWMAEHYPNASITAVSNSASQRRFIEDRARQRDLGNIRVLTCDVNQLELTETFDRVVSVEMFEHVRNYRQLMANIARWLDPGGKLFVHIFCHRELMYPFETDGKTDWMARNFFTGGMMPAADTLLWFQQALKIEEQWRLSGNHYRQTAEAWLANLDRHQDELMALLDRSCDDETDARVWFQRWRIFFMSCAELFGFRDGREWMVAHYRFSTPAR